MCTAATYKTEGFYFGRTLDYEFSYNEEVTVTPRNFCFSFTHTGEVKSHYAIIGMAFIKDGYPLYYDGVNEKGLAMAGLNFVGNAVYGEIKEDKVNIAPYELIPQVLSLCESVKEAKELLENANLINTPFSQDLPLAQLHWIIADKEEAITVEAVREGLKIYNNPLGVLTNNPPFGEQLFNLNNYMSLSPKSPQNNFSDRLALEQYSRGMGAIGLPGDLSSMSRFVRAAFVKMNSVSGSGEEESVNQFFHILGSVDQQRGCCCLGEDKYEITVYTSCCNCDKGIYYYTTYNNHQITAVDMNREKLDASGLVSYPLVDREQIKFLN